MQMVMIQPPGFLFLAVEGGAVRINALKNPRQTPHGTELSIHGSFMVDSRLIHDDGEPMFCQHGKRLTD